ncbi:VWA domain-containing protein [Scandinavium sp. H11S7]|uniref:VWA domain-containing protein n=1 Tax=Scandinavium hiltneri TaxID=2926519 RepID=A0ABT2DWP3_9ENTR|nr:VWA domain-containing protein [Scandinavium hiltneri]MCS2160045.1 VWA domain-containing protein [Scandinavium hiltneri]
MSDLHFLRPWWLAGIVVLVIAALIAHRRQSRDSEWFSVIDPKLAGALVHQHRGQRLLNRLNILWLLLTVGLIAMAGPSWHKQIPEGLREKAAVMVVFANGTSMYAGDVVPNRNRAAKAKIDALRQRLPQSSFGVIAWANTAHLVIPLTQNNEFFNLFMPPLEPDLMPVTPRPESALRAALALADESSKNNGQPVNIVVVTDTLSSLDDAALRAFYTHFPALEVLVVGTKAGGALRFAPYNTFSPGTTQVPIAAFDALKQAGIPVLSMTTDDQDLNWLTDHIRNSVRQSQNESNRWRWQDSGYWLVLLMLPLAVMLFRRLSVAAVLFPLLLSTTFWAPQAKADWNHLWWTPDQLGQKAMNNKDYPAAATLYTDSYRKGRAYYLAKEYQNAAAAFHNVDSAEGNFYLANSLAQLQQYQAALHYYAQALQCDPTLLAAKTNAATVKAILEETQKKQGKRQRADNHTDFSFLKIEQQHAKTKNESPRSAKNMNDSELNNWMSNVDTSPKEMLKSLFILQSQGE